MGQLPACGKQEAKQKEHRTARTAEAVSNQALKAVRAEEKARSAAKSAAQEVRASQPSAVCMPAASRVLPIIIMCLDVPNRMCLQKVRYDFQAPFIRCQQPEVVDCRSFERGTRAQSNE